MCSSDLASAPAAAPGLVPALIAHQHAVTAAHAAFLAQQTQLHAQLLGVISGPARGLATVINAVPSSVARVIQAHADEGEEG